MCVITSGFASRKTRANTLFCARARAYLPVRWEDIKYLFYGTPYGPAGRAFRQRGGPRKRSLPPSPLRPRDDPRRAMIYDESG